MIEYNFDKSKFKDKMDRNLTQGLFWEYRHPDYPATFCLKEKDIERQGKIYISLKNIYLEIADITEYQFAIEIFGSWTHWEKILKSGILLEHILQWRKELEIKLRSEGIRQMIKASREGSKGAAAAKWLAEAKWKGSGRGRPSAEEVEREKKIQAGISNEVSEDLQRIRLVK